jgi:hypothetical protein
MSRRGSGDHAGGFSNPFADFPDGMIDKLRRLAAICVNAGTRIAQREDQAFVTSAMDPKMREEALSLLYWRRWFTNFGAFFFCVLIVVFRDPTGPFDITSLICLGVILHSYAETNGKIRLLLLARAFSEKDSQSDTRGL